MIGKINDAVTKMVISELEKNGIKDIVPSHGGILAFLYQFDKLSVKELSVKINRSQPTVTVLVNKLVNLGYVEKIKDKEDSRITWIKLTQKGIQFQPVFQSISEKLNLTIYGDLKDSDREQFEHLLEHVYRRF